MNNNLLGSQKEDYIAPTWEYVELPMSLNLLETLSIEGSILDFEDTEYEDFQ